MLNPELTLWRAANPNFLSPKQATTTSCLSSANKMLKDEEESTRDVAIAVSEVQHNAKNIYGCVLHAVFWW